MLSADESKITMKYLLDTKSCRTILLNTGEKKKLMKMERVGANYAFSSYVSVPLRRCSSQAAVSRLAHCIRAEFEWL